MKRLISFILVATFIMATMSFIACGETQPQQLATPSGFKISESGLATWNAVENATGYKVKVDSTERPVQTATYYQLPSDVGTYTVSVIATAEGYEDSLPTAQITHTVKPTVVIPDVAVAIEGTGEIMSGKTANYSATVTGTQHTSVDWSIVSGSEYATINELGKLKTEQVAGDKIVVIRATSQYDESAYAEKAITILAQPELTEDMFEILYESTIGFEGYVTIDVYTDGKYSTHLSTYVTEVQTAMDGNHWWAQYQNNATGTNSSLYMAEYEGLACSVAISFNNDESYIPMTEKGNTVTWADAGLYNNFIGVNGNKKLSVKDFRFNPDTWRFDYIGGDKELIDRMVSSANPYDFVPTGFSLIVDEGEILGIYSESEPDYSMLQGYKCMQTLTAAVNYGETVEVRTLAKYQTKELHPLLTQAISNMKGLESYTLDYFETSLTVFSSLPTVGGYDETITDTDCYFRPYTLTYNSDREAVKNYDDNGVYGYHKFGDNFFNSYSKTNLGYSANRAFTGDFSKAKPSFDFAAEIFTEIKDNREEDGTVTFYVDDLMTPVASAFYYGVGNDINLYGIFATRSFTTEQFTPYLVVKDGYIIESGFYFYMGSIYGIIEIHYTDFNCAVIPDGKTVDFESRQAPSSWKDKSLLVYDRDEQTGENGKVAYDCFNDYLGAGCADKIPFIGSVLGDTYGFALMDIRRPGGYNKMVNTIVIYYDVPLDTDYTINSSIKAIENLLIQNGFECNSYGEYIKDDIGVLPVDNSLDLFVYVWKV